MSRRHTLPLRLSAIRGQDLSPDATISIPRALGASNPNPRPRSVTLETSAFTLHPSPFTLYPLPFGLYPLDFLTMAPGQLSDSFCLEFLLTNQNADGGWGFHPASSSAVEATAWALLAVISSRTATSPYAEVCSRACEWLAKAQLPDGSWPAFPGHPQGCWVTSLVSMALHLQGGSQPAVERGRDWVLNAWSAEHSLWWRIKQTILPNRAARQNSALSGWSWTPQTASWVEPTAHALLFLESLPAEMLPPRAAKRRQLAESMLFDRMCPGGGWNSGNPLVYGVGGVPRIGPTAWALMALRGFPSHAAVRLSLDVLEKSYPEIKAAGSLAIAHRCLVMNGRHSASFPSGTLTSCAQNDFYENILTMAWIVLAMNEKCHAKTSEVAANV